MICPYCEAQNPDQAEICVSCKQRFTVDIDFSEPLRGLANIANEMVRREFPADPSLLKDEFAWIVEEMDNLLDKAVSVIEAHIGDIRRKLEEGELEEGELNLETFDKIMGDFDKAQNDIFDGLRIIQDDLIEARTDEEISRGFQSYSDSMRQIRDGIARIQTITYGTSDTFSLTRPPEELNFPPEIFRSRRQLEKALKGLEAFYRVEDTLIIRYSLVKIFKAQEMLMDLLEDYGEEFYIEDYLPEEPYYDEGYDIQYEGELQEAEMEPSPVEPGDIEGEILPEVIEEEIPEEDGEDMELMEEETEEEPADDFGEAEEPPEEEAEENLETDEESVEQETGEETGGDEEEEDEDEDEDEEFADQAPPPDKIIMPKEIEEACRMIGEKGYESILRDDDWRTVIEVEQEIAESEKEEAPPPETQ